jgi:hypothetical protein
MYVKTVSIIGEESSKSSKAICKGLSSALIKHQFTKSIHTYLENFLFNSSECLIYILEGLTKDKIKEIKDIKLISDLLSIPLVFVLDEIGHCVLNDVDVKDLQKRVVSPQKEDEIFVTELLKIVMKEREKSRQFKFEIPNLYTQARIGAELVRFGEYSFSIESPIQVVRGDDVKLKNKFIEKLKLEETSSIAGVGRKKRNSEGGFIQEIYIQDRVIF